MIKCKITVLKTSFNKELVDKYVENERKKTLGTQYGVRSCNITKDMLY
jgi:hypothetical protein